jgi:hypothetical protein
MATADSLAWQSRQRADSREALGHDLRAAAEEASRLGRPLTEAEFDGFRVDRRTTVTPITRLVYVGDKLVAA